MPNYNYFLKEDYLSFCKSDESGIAKNSSSSYASYLGRFVDAIIDNPQNLFEGKSIFGLMPKIASYDLKNDTSYVNTIVNLLYFLPYDNKYNIPKKAYHDGKSALAAFVVFTSTDDFVSAVSKCPPLTKSKINNIIRFLQKKATSQVYDYNLLSANFLSRLRTQDRFPINGVYYPVRLLSKIFKNDPKHDFAKLLRELVAHILVFVRRKDNSLYVRFLKEISKMTFKSNYVEVKFKNDSNLYYLQTELSDYILLGKRERYSNQTNNGLKGINIQHKPAINGELKNKNKYPSLSTLKGHIDNLCNNNNLDPKLKNASKISKLFNPAILSPQEIEGLWREILKLDGAITLSLMDESENKILKDK